MSSTILVMGLNHATAPIDIRERVYCTREEIARLMNILPRDLLAECVILSTCNRTEFYVVTADPTSAEIVLRQALSERAPVLHAPRSDYLFSFSQEATVRHLFGVASGIASLIVGEFEILHQVRAAYEQALEQNAAGALLSHLFLNAIHVGKRARAETQIGTGAASIAYAAVQLAQQVVGELAAKRVLIIGAGEMGTRIAKNLAAHSVAAILVSNRSYEHARALAQELGGAAIHFESLAEAMGEADVVISATGAPHTVVSAAMVAHAMAARQNRPLCLIDMALPRDIEPTAGEIQNVRLFNVDDLQNMTEQNQAARQREIARVEAIIQQEAEAFWNWFTVRRAAPTLKALYTRAEAIRRGELDKTLRRHSQLNAAEREALEAMTKSLMKKLLAEPTLQLKARVETGDGEDYLNAIRELFDLDENGNV